MLSLYSPPCGLELFSLKTHVPWEKGKRGNEAFIQYGENMGMPGGADPPEGSLKMRHFYPGYTGFGNNLPSFYDIDQLRI